MTFEQRDLCEKDATLLNEVRDHFFNLYSKKVDEWNKIARAPGGKQKQVYAAYIQGHKDGLKFSADMLMHLLGQKTHEDLTPLAPAIPGKTVQES